MAIRLAINCAHCESLSASNHCMIHEVKVNENYTCDRFSLQPKLEGHRHCGSCAKQNSSTCAHPSKASEGMLCTSWAPQA